MNIFQADYLISLWIVLIKLDTFEEMEDKVFRHCPESHYQKQKRISEKDKLLVLYIHYLLPVRISELQI